MSPSIALPFLALSLVILVPLHASGTPPAADSAAYPHRNTVYVCNVHGRWDTPAEDRKGMEWARGFFRDMAPHATGGVYVNFLTDDVSDGVKAAYGPNFQKLTVIKKKYDPQNLFRTNQNIRPTV